MPAPTATLVSVCAALSHFVDKAALIHNIDDAIGSVPGVDWSLHMTRGDHITIIVHGPGWSDTINVIGAVNEGTISVTGISGNGWSLADCDQPDKVSIVFDIPAPGAATQPLATNEDPTPEPPPDITDQVRAALEPFAGKTDIGGEEL